MQRTLQFIRPVQKRLAYLVLYPNVWVCVQPTVNILFGSKGFPGCASYLCSDGCCASLKVVTNVRRRVQIDSKLSKHASSEGNRRVISEWASCRCRQQKEKCFHPFGETFCASNNGMGVRS